MDDMYLDYYQSEARETAIYPGYDDTTSIFGLAYTAMGLAGEAGEVSNKVKKIVRDQQGVINGVNRVQIAAELGDVLWYVAQTASQLGYSLGYIAEMNLNKLEARAANGTLQGSGDNR